MRYLPLILLIAACKPWAQKDPTDDTDVDDTDPIIVDDTDESDTPVDDTDESDTPVDDTDESDTPVDDTDESDTPVDDTDDTDDTDAPDTDDSDAPDTDDSDPVVDTIDSGPPGETGDTGGGNPGDTGDSGGDDSADTGSDTADDTVDAPTDSGTARPAWSHALVIDGDLSDCPPEATFQTSSGAGTWACITWTDTDLYLGFHHPDVATGGADHYLWAYIGGKLSLGGTQGVAYNTQQPGLSPVFQTHVRWRANNTFNSRLTYAQGAWGSEAVGYLFSPGALAEDHANQDVELRIPLADLTETSVLPITFGWLLQTAGVETTYAKVPAAGFTNGYDPDLRSWYTFDLTSPAAPNSYAPILVP